MNKTKARRIKLIYNPNSGDKSFRYDLDPCIKALQEGGYNVNVYRAAGRGDIEKQVLQLPSEGCDALAVCGGDGTVNIVVNAMMSGDIRVPLGVIPSGTANDFAVGLKIPQEYVDAAEIIAKGKTTAIDIGKANERYFVNVCAAGMLTNISQQIDIGFKNTFGKLAYYIKGVEQLPNFVPLKLKITGTKRTYNEEVYFFCALNTTGTGGFNRLSPNAVLDDGMLDFLAIRAMPLHELALLFLKMLTGEYLEDNRVLFFRDSSISVEAQVRNVETDVDGEAGPMLPVEIQTLPGALNVFVP